MVNEPSLLIATQEIASMGWMLSIQQYFLVQK